MFELPMLHTALCVLFILSNVILRNTIFTKLWPSPSVNKVSASSRSQNDVKLK